MKSFALYVHLPFCVKKCPYCAFASDVAHGPLQIEKTLEGIVASAELFSSQTPWKDMTVHSLFFGGGTPSIMTGQQVLNTTGMLRDIFKFESNAECSIEVNPGTITTEKIEGWLSAGINRISLGVQSLDDSVLNRLSRIHSADDARRGFSNLRDAGFPQLSVDLIYGTHVPDSQYDPVTSWRRTIEEIIRWNPEHISAYGLTIEDGTPFYDMELKGEKIKSDEQIDLEQYLIACDLLAESGYEHYEISNWAKQDTDSTPSSHQSLHNLSYWNGSSYLALGPSSHSFDAARKKRFWNYRDTNLWLESLKPDKNGIEGSEILTPLQEYEEGVMLGLRMIEGIPEKLLAELASKANRHWPPHCIDDLLNEGLLERMNKILRYTTKGMVVANEVEVRLTG
ncbi:MAG: radical SAM family heme chaperone HemW [Candidatus Electryonea clarkiae]|nr:radical SAM family heme chaperone HemW [Candidatus Electryonea clarkiae]MDP8287521.1 radical SAM family heme chaperone HemW [Candidatus Electryonea clarkiae]